MRNNVTEFPLNKEDIMRLKPEDICGRVWKESKYGLPVADIPNDKRLKVVRNDVRNDVRNVEPIQPTETTTITTVERKNMIAPEIIEKIDNYIEDTAEKVWYIMKGLFKK